MVENWMKNGKNWNLNGRKLDKKSQTTGRKKVEKWWRIG